MKLNNYLAFCCLLNIAIATFGTLVLVGVGFRWSTFILTVANLGIFIWIVWKCYRNERGKTRICGFYTTIIPEGMGPKERKIVYGTYPPRPESNGH